MENIINIFHYCIYLIDRKLHFLSNKINPFLLMYKIPYFQKKAKENGENLYEIYNDTFTNKNYGFNIMVAAGITIGVIFILMVAFLKTAIFILNFETKLNSGVLIFLGLISYLICYFLIFTNDKYLRYFKNYSNWTKSKRRRNIWLCILFKILSISFLFFSLLYLNH